MGFLSFKGHQIEDFDLNKPIPIFYEWIMKM
jgi:hypothetical protein